MTSEISSNSGYFAVKAEAVEGVVAGTPNIYGLLYNETLSTELNPNTDTAIFGNKFARWNVVPGVRSHSGDLEVMAEPNTTSVLWKSLLTEGTITGSDPYTHPLTASFTKPASLTVDISMGNQVARYIGVQASEISPSWTDNEMRWKIKVSALKAFLGAEIASVTGAIATLKTPVQYPAPTNGLIAGDIMSIVKASDGTRQNVTISSITATTVTFGSSPTGVTAGDMLIIRPATTPSPALLDPFLWSRTEFRFADTAANALTATHTPLEDGSEFVVSHPFEDDKGAQSSGSFDPSRLVRSKSADVTFKAKKYFEDPFEVRRFNALTSQACVIRMFSGTSYEFRLTMNKLTITKGGDKAMLKVDEELFYEPEYTPSYSTTDGQGFDVKTLNQLSS